MKSLLITATIAIMTLVLNAADLTGIWKGSMETQAGNTEVTLTFRPGATPAGTAKMSQYEGPIENATLNDSKLHFDVNIEHGKVTFDGTVEGDEAKFDVTGTQGNKYSLVCKRVAAGVK
jgi:hypothetical protein